MDIGNLIIILIGMIGSIIICIRHGIFRPKQYNLQAIINDDLNKDRYILNRLSKDTSFDKLVGNHNGTLDSILKRTIMFQIWQFRNSETNLPSCSNYEIAGFKFKLSQRQMYDDNMKFKYHRATIEVDNKYIVLFDCTKFSNIKCYEFNKELEEDRLDFVLSDNSNINYHLNKVIIAIKQVLSKQEEDEIIENENPEKYNI